LGIAAAVEEVKYVPKEARYMRQGRAMTQWFME